MLEKILIDAKRYLPQSLGVLCALGALYFIVSQINKKQEIAEDFAPGRVNEFLDWNSEEQAYRGLIYNPKTRSWDSPNIFPQGITFDAPAITNTFPTSRNLEQKTNSKPNLLEPPKPKIKTQKPGTLEQFIRDNIAPESFSETITLDYVCRIINQESKWNPNAIGSKEEVGLMQIMPGTWYEQTKKLYGKKWGREWAHSPVINVEVGINYLKEIDLTLSKRIPNYKFLTKSEKQSLISGAYNCGLFFILEINGDITRTPLSTQKHIKATVEREA